MKASNQWEKALQWASGRGLNLFASVGLEKFPSSLREAMLRAGVPLSRYRSLGLFAHGGRTLWENLPKPVKEEDHPVDRHSLETAREFLQWTSPEADSLFLYPSQEFVIPLQQLGRFLHLAHPSPLGLDISPRFGPWFAYRAAFLSTAQLPELIPEAEPPPCGSCVEKACLTACPARAAGIPFHLEKCAGFRLQAGSLCEDRCLSRIACPFREEHRYSEEQIRYHMLRVSHLRKLMEIAEGK